MLSSLAARLHASLPVLTLLLVASSLSIKLVASLWLRSLELTPEHQYSGSPISAFAYGYVGLTGYQATSGWTIRLNGPSPSRR